MGALTIPNLDDATVAAIKRQADERGISMEEEIRRALASIYADGDQHARRRDWARQQLERLKRGELPKADRSSVDEIRAGREERERRYVALKEKLSDSIARGGTVTDEELDLALARKSAALAKDGY